MVFRDALASLILASNSKRLLSLRQRASRLPNPTAVDPLFLPAMWRATLVVGAPRHSWHRFRSTNTSCAPSRAGSTARSDIGEAGAMSRHTGGAVCVLYFNPMGEGGAAGFIHRRVRGPGPAAVRVPAGVTGQRQRVLGRFRRTTGGPGFTLRRGF